jgi:hypothetical protein
MNTLENNEYWEMTQNEDARAIELHWKAATAAMSAEDFKQALEQLASHIAGTDATGTLVDLREFGFAPTLELDEWRREKIVPAYNAGGLKRFAYLLPPGVEDRPGGSGDSDAFATDWFDDAGEARSWLRDA